MDHTLRNNLAFTAYQLQQHDSLCKNSSMPVSSPIPGHILHFVADNLDSIPELESLLLLSESAGKSWTPEELAARIYVSGTEARLILNALHRRGLLSQTADTEVFKFAPADENVQSVVAELGETYQRHLIPLTIFLHSKGTAAVKEFARAFDLKKGK